MNDQQRTRSMMWSGCTGLTFAMLLGMAAPAGAATYYVAAGAAGTGTVESPLGRIQGALDVAQPGDEIVVLPGTYLEALSSVRPGGPGAPITIRAQVPGTATVRSSASSPVRIAHSDHVVDGLVIDADYGNVDGLVVDDGGHRFVLRDSEVRRTTKDCVDIRRPTDVSIERSRIHHCLNAAGGRTDAHGVAAGAVRNLTIRDTDIYDFSGDALQVDPNRASIGWDNVVVERCRFWLAPLEGAQNGFPAGTVPGENAIDTKASNAAARGTLTVRDTEVWGFRGGLIANMAAFNFKENVNVVVDGVTVRDSNIAFRVRGQAGGYDSALVEVRNTLIHDVAYGVRYENDVERFRLYHATFGRGVGQSFLAASSTSAGLDVRNTLFLGGVKPPEAAAASNVVVALSTFVDALAQDYHLAGGATSAIDRGETLAQVTVDRDGRRRPQLGGHDVGAYEYCPSCASAPTAPTNVRIIVP